MNRLTTDEPKSRSEVLMNLAYAKGGEIYVRRFDGKKDMNVNEIVRNIARYGDDTTILDDIADDDIFETLIQLGDGYYSTLILALATQAAELHGWLKKYEDAEEQGRLVKLPFSEDAELYVIADKTVKEERRKVNKEYVVKGGIDRFYFVNGVVSFDVALDNSEGTYLSLTNEDIGETVFFTREEAEKALKGVTECTKS